MSRDRFGERDHDGMPGFAVVHRLQLVSPPAQELERACGVADFVTQVVRPATEGIDTLKCRPVDSRCQPGHDTEVFVMSRCQALRR